MLDRIIDRLINNWKTTLEAVIPGIVLVLAWWGFDVDPKVCWTIAGMLYAIILLFAKDVPREE